MDAIDKVLGVAIGIDRKEEAIRETAKAETYRAMYETLLNKIIQGGQTDV